MPEQLRDDLLAISRAGESSGFILAQRQDQCPPDRRCRGRRARLDWDRSSRAARLSIDCHRPSRPAGRTSGGSASVPESASSGPTNGSGSCAAAGRGRGPGAARPGPRRQGGPARRAARRGVRPADPIASSSAPLWTLAAWIAPSSNGKNCSRRRIDDPKTTANALASLSMSMSTSSSGCRRHIRRDSSPRAREPPRRGVLVAEDSFLAGLERVPTGRRISRQSPRWIGLAATIAWPRCRRPSPNAELIGIVERQGGSLEVCSCGLPSPARPRAGRQLDR